MPLYVIERAFAEDLELTGDDVRAIDEINADEGVRWLFSFLSADRRHTYCLYEAPVAGRDPRRRREGERARRRDRRDRRPRVTRARAAHARVGQPPRQGEAGSLP